MLSIELSYKVRVSCFLNNDESTSPHHAVFIQIFFRFTFNAAKFLYVTNAFLLGLPMVLIFAFFDVLSCVLIDMTPCLNLCYDFD